MSKTWLKSNLTTITTDNAGKEQKRTFNNINSNVTEEKINNFGKIIAELTGKTTTDINLTVVSAINE
ncbi:MAG: hypothetical protein ABF483_02820 [Liquorilactobacillus nagelii]|jgi:hypothetical protein|uniref:DUF1659 domain-containing protein n=1 Tax=Liquorilactobacillus nagelii TaxID=82688 RepID=A0A3Q8CF33_9LACO|nr:hypothetical protein [Liquorilactobacillus nagelii]AUJ32065.1 hypothetical protein BSQ50_05540 [Liquorilactobacillus nagelii]KRL41041.1 hypothetical protein FD45_GL001697 [Liquorilactobacillus nagelii DSM 13675]MCC7615220.1 hypothetical protein [Liquorilactobacillus nagelii]MCP9314887.1 hypothetical protein [Liquorilactobacillus nagelii]QYH53983.1 hypothetical protein G6O73_04445 [Liquorilactobacillus nagelii DSM 13675]